MKVAPPGSSVRALIAILLITFALTLLSTSMLWAIDARELADEMSQDRIFSRIEDFAALESRMSGYPGNEVAGDYVIDAFEQFGLETHVQEFDLPTPLETGASLAVGDVDYDIHGLWPNLSRTSAVPSEGITGNVIYVEDGRMASFNDKDVVGSIVLMDFNVGQDWTNAAQLDAGAVIFIEPDDITRGEAEKKFMQVPVNVPRFWLSQADAEELIALADEDDVEATVTADIKWQNRVNRNIIGILPGADPQLRDEAMIVSAYYDSISVVPTLAPGAENAVSISTLLEIAEIFSQEQYRPARSVIFLATSGHFTALAGAREFVHLWGAEPRRERHRRDRYNRMERELAGLERELEDTHREIRRMRERMEEFEREKADLPPAQIERQQQMASRIIVGQLELDEEYAYKRVERLQDDIARKNEYMQIWEALDQFDKVHMFIGLDLSTRNRRMGAFQVGHYFTQDHLLRFYSPLGRQFNEYALETGEAFGLDEDEVARRFIDGINPVRGREWHTFFPERIAFDHEMLIRGGRPAVTFTTVNDVRRLVNTPFDTPDRLNMGNLMAQGRMLVNMLHRFLAEDTLSERALQRVEALRKMDDLETVEGTVLEFERRESFVPNTPVPDSLVLMQGRYRVMSGVHTTVWHMANESSEFAIRGEMETQTAELEAYNFDPDSGDIAYAPDRGVDGDQRYPREVHGRAGLKRPIIVFRCVPTEFHDIVDERYFQTLERIFVYDATDFSEPISFGYSMNEMQQLLAAEFPSYVEPSAVVFSMPDQRMQATMSMGVVGIRLILINATPEVPTGRGFPAKETPRIAMTPLQVANDMWQIDRYRLERLERHGIANQRVIDLHEMAAESLATANQAMEDRQYDVAMAAARHAWGYESRAYPEVQKTAEDVIVGVLFYLAILLPFAFFGERLLVHSRTIIGQIIGTVAVFVVFFLMLALVHPAFALTTSPPIILLAFIVMALAVLVIGIVTIKFNQELKAMKQSTGGKHDADVGRLSVAGAAFGLGIANMRRRKARTGLTAVTLILLTFTVLSFTSVTTYLRANEVALGHEPPYEGVLLRDRSWLSLEAPVERIIDNELQKIGTVSPRAWYSSTDLEREMMIDLATADDTARIYTVNALLGLSPQETEVMATDQMLVAGRWFEENERDAIILPASIAASMGVTEDEVGETAIDLFGTDYTIIGLIDDAAMRETVDLDGEPMLPVNYSMLRPEVIEELQRQAERRSQLGATGAGALLDEYEHYDPDQVAIIPYTAAMDMGGTLRSVAVRFAETEQVAETVESMMRRFAVAIYAGMDNTAFMISTVGLTAAAGLETMAIPILIAALIVLNTMLGAVYERTTEIGIYSSLGLAPSHIAILFLAEAAVFANLGAIMGYLIGQVLAKIIHVFDIQAGVELNYSSLSAVGVTIVVVIVVLLSTIYPSKQASEIASPGIARKWELPDPEGDLLLVKLPFTVTGRDAFGVAAFLQEYFSEYVGYAGGEFLAEDVRLEAIGDEVEDGVAVKLRMWLAPYDLGVSQDFELACIPTEDEDIFAIEIRLQRLAGDITSWKKTNALFLSSIRKQFLIWRTVPQDEKVAYGEEGERVIEEGVITV